MLADGLAVYTPGFSDHRGSASTFSHTDFLGSLRFLTDSGQNVTANLLPDAFGEAVSQMGTVATPFGWNGTSGYQSDADGLKLLGHRYYNSRTGRFITQDPAGAGTNWYAYAGNNPTNKKDPLGLAPIDGPGSSPVGSPGYSGDTGGGGLVNQEDDYESEVNNQQVNQNIADMSTAILNSLAQLTQDIAEEANWVSDLTFPSVSISAGPFHFDGSFGLALQGPGFGATGWGLEAFGSVNAGLGIGLGVSASTGKPGSIGFGWGNLNGFNGGSWFGTILAQPLTSLTYSQSLTGGYKGIQIGLPAGGLDVGLYGGLGYTKPIFSVGNKK